MKTEKEMAGIYRWSHDLIKLISSKYPISVHEVASPDTLFYNQLLYPLANLFGKDLSTAIKNYPAHFENHSLRKPKLWHLASQTFARIIPVLNAPSLITVFDLYPYIFKLYPSSTDQHSYCKTIENIPRADFIMTLSQSAKSEIVHTLSIPPSKISVIYPGIDPQFRPLNVPKDRYQIIYVGSELPRKNLTTLFESLKIVFDKVPKAHFIKVGRPQWSDTREQLRKLAHKLGILDRIQFLDYVEDLPKLYSSSGLSVLVSTHEGFGYPALEAMACGIPTVLSDIPSLREITGEHSTFVDPHDSGDIANAIIKVLETPSIQQKIIINGLEHIHNYAFASWSKRMISFYNELILKAT